MRNGILAATHVLAVATAICALMLPSVADAHDGKTTFTANDTAFLKTMGNLEGLRGSGTVSEFTPALPERPRTEMTLTEVPDFQRNIRAMGTISYAVGRNQFIYLNRMGKETLALIVHALPDIFSRALKGYPIYVIY